MTRRLAGSMVLFLLLATAYSCKKEETTTDTSATDTAPATDTTATINQSMARQKAACTPSGDVVCVTLQVTGIAYLIGDAGTATRLLVVPDKTAVHHTAHLLTRGAHFTSKAVSLLDREKNDVNGFPYFYRDFPAGVEIDLVESGWEKPTTPVLDLAENGDPTIPCPEEGGTKISAESLYWLPRLPVVSKHTGGKPALKAAFTKPKPLAADVVTRLEITDGKLASMFAGDHIAKWKFERNGPAADDHVQAVGSYLLYTFKAKLKTVNAMKLFVLRGRKFTDGTVADIATFKPDGGHVIITLANVVHDSFFDPNTNMDEIDHFDEYYKIYEPDANKPKDTRPMRIKKEGIPDNCALNPGDSGVECGPGQP